MEHLVPVGAASWYAMIDDTMSENQLVNLAGMLFPPISFF
jgi:hypothetical protein